MKKVVRESEKETTSFILFSNKLLSMMYQEPGLGFDINELNEFYIYYKESEYDSIEEFVNFFFEDHTPDTHFEWLRDKFPEETVLFEAEGKSVGDNYE